MNFKEKLNHWQNQVNQSLDEFLPGSGEHPAQLHQAIRYSVHAGGKRLAPILVLAAHELYPGSWIQYRLRWRWNAFIPTV